MNIITPFETGTHVGGIAAQNARTGTMIIVLFQEILLLNLQAQEEFAEIIQEF